MNRKLYFASDYQEGAHPALMVRLTATNMEHTDGYGVDPYSESARKKIREACGAPDAEIHFLAGGTQANLVVIAALLRSYEGVIAADTGHIAVHEAGAIEHTGHKVLSLPHKDGKLTAAQIDTCVKGFLADDNRDHMVHPGMVYISQPTENGTLYSRRELAAISAICRTHGLKLYLDGARLAYALATPENDVTLADLAALCDVFYIGGTKCGALFGEAVVIPVPSLVPHFFTIVKQHGALLAKGRIAGVQFDTLFTDGLYTSIGDNAIRLAARLRDALSRLGFRFHFETPTNQIFVVMENDRLALLSERVVYSFWETVDDTHTAIRFATSWATAAEDVDALIEILETLA